MRLYQRAGLTLFLGLCAGGTARAQFDQYMTPGGPVGRPEDARGKLAKEVAGARYHLGALRIAPSIGFKDVAYVKTLLATGQPAPSDFTATLGGGLRLYLPTGSKTTWTAYALPEYVWWQKLADRRRFNQRLGGGFHAFGNRVTLEATAGRDEAQRILTPDLPRLANSREDHAGFNAELQVTPRFSLFANGQALRQKSLADRNDPEAPLLALLDRHEQIGRLGVHWRPFTGLILGVGVERSRVDFSRQGHSGEPDRSNAGTAPVFEAAYDHNRIFWNLDLAARSLEATQGSDFVRYHKVTGQASLAYRTAAGPELFFYGHRNLIYSIFPLYPYLDEERVGASLHFRLGHRSHGNLYAERGTDGYTASVAGAPNRKDDVTSFGGALQVDLGHAVSVTLSGVRSRFLSNLPGEDRSFTSLGVTVALAGSP